MEGNNYFLPLRNAKRYSPYEFDDMMSQNENRMDTLGKIIDQDIYNCMMADRKTPLVLTPKLILDNGNGINSIGPKKSNNFNSQSQQILKNPLREVSTESFRILQTPMNMNSMQRQKYINDENIMINNNKELQQNLNDNYTRFNPEDQMNSYHWKYDGPSGFNTEKKHYPRMVNNGNYYKNDEPVKINHTDFNSDLYNRNNEYPQKYNNNLNNNTFKSQDFSRSRSNNYMRRRPTPYNEENNDRYIYSNNRYNNNDNNFDEGNNREFRNRSFRAFSPERYQENRKNDEYVRRGNYNSQLNFPYDRYDD